MPQKNDGENLEAGNGSYDLLAPARYMLVLQLPQQSAPEVHPVFRKTQARERIHMEILLIDDNPADVRMVLEGLKEALPDARLSVAADGVEAIRFLRRDGRHSGAPRPDLIFLPPPLPHKTAFHVLAVLKHTPA